MTIAPDEPLVPDPTPGDPDDVPELPEDPDQAQPDVVPSPGHRAS
ncbi:hypothetical protein [Aeromicrobium sp. Root495]|nr:hypothetical protein [Aeromicrobium sp. Root495]